MDKIAAVIESQMHALSRGKKKLASYILRNRHEVIYMKSAEIAAAAGVSESTLVRFFEEIGLSGLKELQSRLRSSLFGNLDLMQLYENSIREKTESDDIIVSALNEEMENINITFSRLKKEQLFTLAEKIIQARRIAVLGFRGTAAPALVLNLFLNEMLLDSRLLTPGLGDSVEYINTWDENDLIISFDFTPMDKMTVNHQIVDYAKSHGCSVVSIVSDPANPITSVSDLYIQVETRSPYVSLTSSIVLVNVLLHIINSLLPEERLLRAYKETEKVIAAYLMDWKP